MNLSEIWIIFQAFVNKGKQIWTLDDFSCQLDTICDTFHMIWSTTYASHMLLDTNYLNQCWLIISEVLWHSPESNFTRNANELNP